MQTPTAAAPGKPAATAAARPMKDDRAMEDPKPVAPKAISEVDVVAKLEKLASENPAQLNWKVSIVDLLKLLDIDSSGAARKELADSPLDLPSRHELLRTPWVGFR